MAMPVLTAPSLPGFGYTPAPVQPFTAPAPKPTPMGAFTAPDPSSVLSDPGAAFRMAQGLKAVQNGAAARGTLLTGGFQKALDSYASGDASQEYGATYGRALSTYQANQGANAQNFNQALGGYDATLAGANANAGATEANNSSGLAAATTGYDINAAAATTANDVKNTNAVNTYQDGQDAYSKAVAAATAQNAAVLAAQRGPKANYSPYSAYSGGVSLG